MFFRGYAENVYVTCGRCQRRVPIAECEWDAGILVCKIFRCRDRSMNGALEYRWAREASRDRQELTPDPKLINPVDISMQLENIPASSGTY